MTLDIEYKYVFSNLKPDVKSFIYILTGIFIFSLLLIILLPKYIKDNEKNQTYIKILILVINVIIFIIIIYIFNNDRSYIYNTTTSIVSNNLIHNYKLDTTFFIKNKSEYAVEVFHGIFDDNIYNPIVYIAPNSTDLIVEIRTKENSEQLYNIYTTNYVDNNNNNIKNTIDICLNKCSDDEDCLGVNYAGYDEEYNCQLILNNEPEINSNDEQIYYYHKKNKFEELYDESSYIGDKVNYNNVCIIKDLPLSSLINLKLDYDHNNIYINVSYEGNTIDKICNFEKLYNSLNGSIKFLYNNNSNYVKITEFQIN